MFSTIIPCYNSEKFIARAIESALNQTETDYEIILVDNNSTDNTVSIINDYAKRYPNIITVLHEYKKGAPAARNKGLHHAKGEWIQFLDSDDELLPNKTEHQLKLVVEGKTDVIVGNSYVYKVIKGKLVKGIRGIESNNVWKGLLTSRLGITSANLWRRNALLAVNGWDESKTSSQEYDLLFRMVKNNANVVFCTTPLSIVHINKNSISNSESDDRIIEILSNIVNLRLEIKAYLKSKDKLTKQLNHSADKYLLSYVLSFSGEYLWYLKKGKISSFIKKTIKENNLDVPIGLILKIYLGNYRLVLKELIKIKI